MPELPDVTIYCEAITRFYAGRVLGKIDLRSPFVVRTYQPDISELEGQRLLDVTRLGKQIVWRFEGDLQMVMHLMIAGRLHRKNSGTRPGGKFDLAAFQFRAEPSSSAIDDTLMLTEQGTKKQASLHVVASKAALVELDAGGLEVIESSFQEFEDRLKLENHTIKRTLTDPRLFSGIGNAYSDEILHAAQLSPVKWTSRLTDEEIGRLHNAAKRTLNAWTERLRAECGDGFPERVTAFRDQMAAHGKFGCPCPTCGMPIARIRYASRETNYCPTCQTAGKLLADRSLSRLLKEDWGKEME
ncbi:MAG: Fpg/Nei family DNA glycosylase [Aeoliella sp.]